MNISGHLEVFYKKGVLENFLKFTGKHLRLRPATFWKRDWRRCFLVILCKIFKNTFSKEHLMWLFERHILGFRSILFNLFHKAFLKAFEKFCKVSMTESNFVRLQALNKLTGVFKAFYIPWTRQMSDNFEAAFFFHDAFVSCLHTHLRVKILFKWKVINPWEGNISFLYPLKISENQRFSDVFRGYRKEHLTWNELIFCFSDTFREYRKGTLTWKEFSSNSW